MIYRILVDQQECVPDLSTGADVWRPSGTNLRGVYTAGMSVGLADIPFPLITNRRARFYFTEVGWQKYGRNVARHAKQAGHVVKVIRRKNPHPSQIVYQDRYQVAILPVPEPTKRARDRQGA
ncbi:MAG TPA: hypothetical protein VGD69_15310 [Herpetosiphonaceae bacterium]